MNSLQERTLYDFLFKVVFVGDSGVGKSALTCRYADDLFYESYISTLGIDFRIKTVRRAGKEIKLQIWDTAGQERFRALTRSYYRGCSGVFLVFDTTSFSSFQSIKFWLSDLQKHGPSNAVKVLIGTKSDLVDRREVPRKTAEDFCQLHNIQYIETSAKNGVNVDLAFNEMINLLLSHFSLTASISTKPDSPLTTPVVCVEPKVSETSRLRCLC